MRQQRFYSTRCSFSGISKGMKGNSTALGNKNRRPCLNLFYKRLKSLPFGACDHQVHFLAPSVQPCCWWTQRALGRPLSSEQSKSSPIPSNREWRSHGQKGNAFTVCGNAVMVFILLAKTRAYRIFIMNVRTKKSGFRSPKRHIVPPLSIKPSSWFCLSEIQN